MMYLSIPLPNTRTEINSSRHAYPVSICRQTPRHMTASLDLSDLVYLKKGYQRRAGLGLAPKTSQILNQTLPYFVNNSPPLQTERGIEGKIGNIGPSDSAVPLWGGLFLSLGPPPRSWLNLLQWR